MLLMNRHPIHYIIAYTCNNFGDDLLILSLLRRFPSVRFYLCVSPEYSKPFKKEKNVLLPSRIEWFILRALHKLLHNDDSGIINYRFLRHSKDIIKIGGSIFIESAGFSWKMFVPKKTHIIGANFEHHYTSQFYEQAKEAISTILSCTFRDSFSYRLFSDLKNVSLAPDAVFSMTFPAKSANGCGIAISVIFPDNRSNLATIAEDYYLSLSEVVDYCESKQIPVALLGFCSFERDTSAIGKILDRVHSRTYPEVCIYDGDIESFIDRINRYASIIATRFHAMVVGWKLDKKVLPVIYSEKQQNVLDDIDYRMFSWNLLNNPRIRGEQLVMHAINAGKLTNINQIAEMSRTQFKAFEDHNTQKRFE